MKFKKMISALIVSTMIFSSVVSASANEITTQDFQAETIQEIANTADFPTTKNQFNFSTRRATNFAVNLAPIQGELLDPTVVGELQITDTEVVENASSEDTSEANIGIAPMLSNSYYWNYRTAYFEPSKMQATSDIDIVWNRYQPGNEGYWDADYQPMGYPSLSASTYVASELQSDFDRFANQGHVNDYLGGAVYGSHSYYTVMTGNFDTITALASNKVRVRIADMTTNSLVFDSGYGSNGQYQSPAAGGNVSYYSTANTTSFGASKTVYHVRFNTGIGARVYTVILSPYEGQYPTDWSQIDNLDPTYHYAFYSGQAVPGKLSASNLTAHSATVQYNANLKYVSSFDSATTATTISVGTPASQNNLYALRNITVKEYVSSRNNLYLNSLNYKFKWPDGTSFYYLNGSPDTFDYTFTSSLSPVGTWQFMFSGSWKDSTNTSNYFMGRTHMTMEYLAPYGYVAKY